MSNSNKSKSSKFIALSFIISLPINTPILFANLFIIYEKYFELIFFAK